MTPPADFRIGRVLRRSRLVFARNFFQLAGIAAIAVIPGLIVPATDGYAPINLGLPTWAPISLYAAGVLLGQSIMCFLAFERMRGRPTSFREGLMVGLHRSLPLVGMSFLLLASLNAPLLPAPFGLRFGGGSPSQANPRGSIHSIGFGA